MRHLLSIADVLDLRLNAHSLRHLGGGVNLGVPYILLIPADDVFCLHAYGSPQTTHKDARVLAECLRQERAEPGFIQRLLDGREPPDLATLNPAERMDRRRAQAAYEASMRAAAQARAEAERTAASRLRYTPQKPLSDLSLDDL